MNFTFGIITHQGQEERINQLIDSIESQNIPVYEIIIVGSANINRNNTTIIPFDESIRQGWITRKKNIITLNAKYENVVYTHDYITLEPEWYINFLAFGDDFKICMNRIINSDGSRFRDWTLWALDVDHLGLNRQFLLPYDVTHLSNLMYISGSYWVAKKDVMSEFPLHEGLAWGEGEDVEWSKRVRNKYEFSINSNSVVRINKEWKDPAFSEMSVENQDKIRNLKTI